MNYLSLLTNITSIPFGARLDGVGSVRAILIVLYLLFPDRIFDSIYGTVSKPNKLSKLI